MNQNKVPATNNGWESMALEEWGIEPPTKVELEVEAALKGKVGYGPKGGLLEDPDNRNTLYRKLAARYCTPAYGCWTWRGRHYADGQVKNSAQVIQHLLQGRGEHAPITGIKHSADAWNQVIPHVREWQQDTGRVRPRKPWLRMSVFDNTVDTYPVFFGEGERELERSRRTFPRVGGVAEALDVLMYPVARHKFADTASKSAYLAAVLMACAREHLGGMLPAIAIDGVRGCGKGLIEESLRVLAGVGNAQRDSHVVAPGDGINGQSPATAWTKALIMMNAELKAGREYSVQTLDEIGGARIDIKDLHIAITSGRIKQHVAKGHAETVLDRESPWFLITGNGLRFAPDMDRRRLQINLLAQSDGWAVGHMSPAITAGTRHDIEDAAAFLIDVARDSTAPDGLLAGLQWSGSLTAIWRAVALAAKSEGWQLPCNAPEVDEDYLLVTEVIRKTLIRETKLDTWLTATEILAYTGPQIRLALGRKGPINSRGLGDWLAKAGLDPSCGVDVGRDTHAKTRRFRIGSTPLGAL